MKKYNLPTAATKQAPAASPKATKRPPLAAAKPGDTYTELLHKFNDASHAYYVESKPIMTDAEFDDLVDRIKQMQQACPQLIAQYGNPFVAPQSDHVDGFTKVAHNYPMLSLQDIYTEEELQKFVKSTGENSIYPNGSANFSVECKLDGLSLSLIYEHGELIRAVTRGNGSEGDDVTAQAKCIPSVPQYLTCQNGDILEYDAEIRGEVVMPWAAFNAYNDACTNEKDKFANPRNAASGTLKSYDPNKCRERGLLFVAYYLEWGDRTYAEQNGDGTGALKVLDDWGFYTPKDYNGAVTAGYDISDIMQAIHHVKAQDYPFPIDGVVVKCNHMGKWNDLGYTDKFYKWGIAFKYNQESLRSRLIQVNWQLAESGRVTPVAIYEPIEMFGTTCQRATLNNPDWIEKNLPGIRIGDTLLLTKGGEIIPKVTGFVPHELTPQEKTRELVMPRSWKEHIDGYGVNDSTLIIQTSGVVVPPDVIGGRETYRQGAYLMARLNEDEQPKPKKPACPVAAKPATVPDASASVSTKLQGKTILVSGNFGTPKIRKDIEAAVIANGGKLAKGVTLSVNYYVLPDNIEEWKHKAGGKWQKIQEFCHQNRIITKDEFYRLIED